MGKKRTALVTRLWRALSRAQGRALKSAVSIAEGRGVDLYLVGGAVRDLMMKHPLDDVDLLVEHDASTFARALERRLKAKAVSHPRFGTASVFGRDFRLDIAQARTELYMDPGALPTVQPAGLEADLERRDFTFNAMALRLAGDRPGELIDLFGGERDLAAGRIRIIHDESFQDDATRIFRALRYAGRFGFQIERTTARCLRRDVGYIDSISGQRLRSELERMALEQQAGAIIQSAFRRRALEAIHPALGADARGRKAVTKLPDLAASHRDAVLLCLLLAGATPADADEAIGRLAMTTRQAKAVAGFLALRAVQDELSQPGLAASRVVELLSPRPVESLEALALVSSRRVAGRVQRYLDEWRFVRTRLNGRDLERLGVTRGPQVGSTLRALLAARLDGNVRTKKDEIAFVEDTMKRSKVRTE